MPITPTQVALAVAILLGLGFVWYYEGRGRWRRRLERRFVYGVPWGTLVTVGIVVAFYLLAQGGIRDWANPVMLPFVTWSYLYPTGLFTAGIAHGSPAHLVSNVAATLAFAPIAEYVWSHYPPPRRDESSSEGTSGSDGSERDGEPGSERPGPDAESDPSPEPGVRTESTSIADGGTEPGPLARPWVRAVVAFPAALLVLALATAVFSLGPGLGFSGAVYAIVGFAVVTVPRAAVVGVVAASALGTLYQALSQPVVRETIAPGAPGPPSWAGVGFQAHAFGFLLGVLLGVGLLRARERRPPAQRVFFATLLIGLVQSLWLVAGSGEDVYTLYRGVGVTLVILLTVLIALAVSGSDRSILPGRSEVVRGPTPRQVAVGWLGVVGLIFVGGLAGAVLGGELVALVPLALLTLLLAFPALAPAFVDRWSASHFSRRGVAVACLLAVTVVVALPSIPLGMLVVADDTVPGSGEVAVEDYAVTYEENATSGHSPAVDLGEDDLFATEVSGVIVVSPDRELWTVGVPDYELEHAGEATVEVGSVGWGETVRAERSGWDVVGNESAYAVDLTVDGETTRSFASDPVRAETVVDGHEVAVAPDADGFLLEVTADGSTVGSEPIPDVGGETTVGDLRFTTETVDGDERVFVETGDTRAQIAERETYE